MRAPILLYQARLGALFGHRLLMLEHIGETEAARRIARAVADFEGDVTSLGTDGVITQLQESL